VLSHRGFLRTVLASSSSSSGACKATYDQPMSPLAYVRSLLGCSGEGLASELRLLVAARVDELSPVA
jgi:hypothetical protein